MAYDRYFQIYRSHIHNILNDGTCANCGKRVAISSFRDKLAMREYEVTGSCQECQDEMYGEGEAANG